MTAPLDLAAQTAAFLEADENTDYSYVVAVIRQLAAALEAAQADSERLREATGDHEGDAGTCPTCGLIDCHGRLQWYDCDVATERERALREAVIAWLGTNHYGEQIAAERRIRAIVYPGSFVP